MGGTGSVHRELARLGTRFGMGLGQQNATQTWDDVTSRTAAECEHKTALMLDRTTECGKYT